MAEQLVQRGCAVTLLISPKEVDQQAVQGRAGHGDCHVAGRRACNSGSRIAFVRGFCAILARGAKSFSKRGHRTRCWRWAVSPARRRLLAAKQVGREDISARIQHHPRPGQSLAGARCGPGLRRFSPGGSAAARAEITVTGTPVRPQIQPRSDAGACRVALGLIRRTPLCW